MPYERVLNFTGIHNFRDYGGYAARDGHLKRGVLWRSGQHATATPDDLERVRDLDIRTVIDLRGDSERVTYPCLRHADFAGEVLFAPGETASRKGRGVHEETVREIVTADDARAVMAVLYRDLPFRDVLNGTYRLYLQALGTRDGGSLLHCLAGKDRTGLGAALVHHLLGVHPDDIMADYVLTNTAGNSEARIAALGAGRSGTRSDAVMRVIWGVEPEYLDTAFAAIRERHGSVEAYARDVLGCGPELVAAMAARLVV